MRISKVKSLKLVNISLWCAFWAPWSEKYTKNVRILNALTLSDLWWNQWKTGEFKEIRIPTTLTVRQIIQIKFRFQLYFQINCWARFIYVVVSSSLSSKFQCKFDSTSSVVMNERNFAKFPWKNLDSWW